MCVFLEVRPEVDVLRVAESIIIATSNCIYTIVVECFGGNNLAGHQILCTTNVQFYVELMLKIQA